MAQGDPTLRAVLAHLVDLQLMVLVKGSRAQPSPAQPSAVHALLSLQKSAWAVAQSPDLAQESLPQKSMRSSPVSLRFRPADTEPTQMGAPLASAAKPRVSFILLPSCQVILAFASKPTKQPSTPAKMPAAQTINREKNGVATYERRQAMLASASSHWTLGRLRRTHSRRICRRRRFRSSPPCNCSGFRRSSKRRRHRRRGSLCYNCHRFRSQPCIDRRRTSRRRSSPWRNSKLFQGFHRRRCHNSGRKRPLFRRHRRTLEATQHALKHSIPQSFLFQWHLLRCPWVELRRIPRHLARAMSETARPTD